MHFPWLGRRSARETVRSPDLRRAQLAVTNPNAVVYAIGDVHGCLDLLLRLEEIIRTDDEIAPDQEKIVIMLGDLVDRGPHSAQVLEHVMKPMPPGFRRLVVAGNHEAAMLSFLDGTDRLGLWLKIGGLETLSSYNVPIPRGPIGRAQRKMLATTAAASIPQEHVDFLRMLPTAISWNRYLFVHAGIRPGIALERQSERDLLEIRGVFTGSEVDHGAMIVHGHSPVAAPERFANRIAVDAAAYATGRLAAVRLKGTQVDFIVADSRAKT